MRENREEMKKSSITKRKEEGRVKGLQVYINRKIKIGKRNEGKQVLGEGREDKIEAMQRRRRDS